MDGLLLNAQNLIFFFMLAFVVALNGKEIIILRCMLHVQCTVLF